MRWGLCLFAAWLSVGSAAKAQQTALPLLAPAVASPAATSLQALFDQAMAAESAGDCRAAMPLLDRLAGEPRVKPGTLPAASVALARGHCLRGDARWSETERPLLEAVPVFERAGPDFAGAKISAERLLGELAASQWRRDDAILHFSKELALLTGKDRIGALAKLAMVASFDPGPQPLGWIDEALRLAGPEDKTNRELLSSLHTIRGRMLMNRGMNREALAELRLALRLAGGLTTNKVTLGEAAMRGDLAQAALLNGDKDQARTYLAYTGAGRIKESPFASATRMDPPPCGFETGLATSDSAIVELAIGENGDVIAAQTVYTRGDYNVAAAFARAVSQWYWEPEALSEIPAFFKLMTRVELRCSTSQAGRPDMLTPLTERFKDWAGPHLPDVLHGSVKIGISKDQLLDFADRQELARNPAGAVAALVTRAIAEPAGIQDGVAALDRAQALSERAKLPAAVTNAITVFRAVNVSTDYRRAWRKRQRKIDMSLLQLADTPDLAADALAQDSLYLLASPELPSTDMRPPTLAVLTKVADDNRLSVHHPLRQYALLRLADASAQSGDYSAAQSYFQRTGLSGQQCALLGPKPVMRNSGASGDDYPLEALQMGFEGWVRMEYDISTNGRTANPRAVIAYPPFVFVNAATGMTGQIRYAATYRPDSEQACSANLGTIRFIIPLP